MNNRSARCWLSAIAAALLMVGTAQAADTPSPPATDRLAPARAQIGQKNWPAAIAELGQR